MTTKNLILVIVGSWCLASAFSNVHTDFVNTIVTKKLAEHETDKHSQ